MKPVTIVIPIYNRASYLPRLFRSLEKVAGDAFKVVLVDNGSQDYSLTLCQEFARTSPLEVEVIVEKGRGAAVARNSGLRACTTEWVYFFDSDDELSPDFLEKVLPLTNDRDVVCIPTVQYEGNSHTVRAYKPTGTPSFQILSSMLNSPSMLLRTAWIRMIGGWNASLSVWDDWELGVRVLLNRPRLAWYTDHAFHRLYVHGESITGPGMSHNLEGKVHTLRVVRNQLSDKRDCMALYFRTCILDGQLQREGVKTALDEFADGIGVLARMGGAFLRWYSRLGFRGAWRVACLLCHSI